VEVIFPEPAELQTGGTANATSESVASASSNAAASTTASIAEKAIGALPSEMAEMANDPKRGPIFRPRLAVWILVRYCKEGDGSVYFLPKKVPAGIQRFKHLSGGLVMEVCPRAPEVVRKEMSDYLRRMQAIRLCYWKMKMRMEKRGR
jgi:hypothetical protein